jgi:hypothetical protein
MEQCPAVRLHIKDYNTFHGDEWEKQSAEEKMKKLWEAIAKYVGLPPPVKPEKLKIGVIAMLEDLDPTFHEYSDILPDKGVRKNAFLW